MKSILPNALLAALIVPLAAEPEWKSIFNGEDLDGWTPKITGKKHGEDPDKTFLVKDGAITVDYSNQDAWHGQFGHLFYKEKLSHYRVRFEYRFTGEQLAEGPAWAIQNSGIMLHCQAPETMGVDQDFPTSLECQLLGAGNQVKTTGNLCTPQTYVTYDGEVNHNHCITGTVPTLPLGEWVKAEAEVRGGEVIRHLINGKVSIEYNAPMLDEASADAAAQGEAQGSLEIREGYFSLQSESHPCQFRNIEIQILEAEEAADDADAEEGAEAE